MAGKNSSDLEVEQQFEAPDLEAVAQWLASQPPYALLTLEPRDAALQRDVYLDTEDWRIHRAGFSLRLRHRNGNVEATLKSLKKGSGGLRGRLELNQQSAAADFADDGPVSERVRLLGAAQSLRPLFEVETNRRRYLVQRDGQTVAELSLDDTRIKAGGVEIEHLRRVEVEETVRDALSTLRSFMQALAVATNLAPAELSKFESGLVAAHLNPREHLDFGATEFAAEDTAVECSYAILRQFFADFLSSEPGTRLGEDPEQVHDMRVAARRLRAALKIFLPILPPEFAFLRDELQWVGRALGEVRDLDVQLEWLLELQEEADWEQGMALSPLIDLTRASQENARQTLLQELESERYRQLVERMSTALRASPAFEAEQQTAREYVTPILLRAYQKFRKPASRLTPHSPLPEFHAVRIKAKRLRYGVEFFRPLFGQRANRMAEEVERVQELLGQLQDCRVSIDWLNDVARDGGEKLPPRTLLLMGQLMERRAETASKLREDWPALFQGVKHRWRQLTHAIEAQDRPQGGADERDVEFEESVSLFRRLFGRRSQIEE